MQASAGTRHHGPMLFTNSLTGLTHVASHMHVVEQLVCLLRRHRISHLMVLQVMISILYAYRTPRTVNTVLIGS